MQGKLMQSCSVTLLTTINIVRGAFGGGSDHFWGEGKSPLNGLYATLTLT